jgi:ABC-2 type transport system permease protein
MGFMPGALPPSRDTASSAAPAAIIKTPRGRATRWQPEHGFLGAPRQPGGFILALVLTVGALFAIGLWIAAIARSANVASLIGNLLLFPMLFFGGLFVARQNMSPVLRDIGDWTPLGASAHALRDSMLGVFPAAQLLLVLAGYAVVFGVLAVRFFRWE